MMSDDKACMIDVISREAVIRNKAKLNNAQVETLPYATSYVDTVTGVYTSHAEMLYYYNNDTWHYSNSCGSTRVVKGRRSKNLLAITKKVYKQFFPKLKIEKVIPLDMISFFPGDEVALPARYINVE